MGITDFRNLIPRPLVATAVVAGSLSSMGESPKLSIALGTIAGIGAYFYPEATKSACTALTAIAVANTAKDRFPNRFYSLTAGVFASSITHFFLSRTAQNNFKISAMSDDRRQELEREFLTDSDRTPICEINENGVSINYHCAKESKAANKNLVLTVLKNPGNGYPPIGSM